MIELGRVESSKTILSLVISEGRTLFTPLLCSGEELRLRSFNSTPLLTQIFRITRVFWNLYDVDVTETLFLVPPVRMDWTRGVELQDVVVTILSL